MARKITKADRKVAKQVKAPVLTEEQEADRDEREAKLASEARGMSQREAVDLLGEAGYPVHFPDGGKVVASVRFRDAKVKNMETGGLKPVRQAVVYLKR